MAEGLLGVALDHVVADVLPRVGVDPERLDPERPPNRLPVQLARHDDRRQGGDVEGCPAVGHGHDASGTVRPQRV